jgi:hypothetical protein
VPKITNDPVRSYPVGLRKSDVEFIEASGIGSNPSEKLRNILDACRATFGRVVNEKGEPIMIGALLAYHQTSDEVIWADKFPFKFNPSHGRKNLMDIANKAGYIYQCVENKSEGLLDIWIAPGTKLFACDQCRQRIIDAINGAI